MRNTFIKTLAEEAESNPKIWLLCGDLGFSVLEPFAARFPDRYINVGVAEQNMAGIAAGIALSGYTVFIYSIGNFPTLRCLEQLRNDVCYHGADVKVVAVGAGFAYGSQGYTHHAIEDVAILSTLPGMEVFVPCDPLETQHATRLIAASGRPSYLRLSRSGEPILKQDDHVDLRKPRILREGKDIAILASGPIAMNCLAAAERLEKQRISAQVISMPCVKPLDAEFVRGLLQWTRGLFVVEEHILRGGLHSAVASLLATEPRRPAIFGLGIPEPHGKISVAGDREALLDRAGLGSDQIASRIAEAMATISV